MRSFASLAALLALVGLGWFAPAGAAAATVRCHGEVATIIGTEGSDRISGTSHRDVIAALGGDDFVDGKGGSDLVCGGRGRDFLSGGAGDDRLYGGLDRISPTDEGTTERIGDILDGGRGRDLLAPGHDVRPADEVSRDVVSWESSPRAVHIDLGSGRASGNGLDRVVGRRLAVVGSAFDDVIYGSSRGDRVNAGAGSDTVRTAGGNDVVYADAGGRNRPGNDRVWGGSGNDQLTSGRGDDVLRGGPGNDVLADYAQTPDALHGGSGNDLIVSELTLTTRRQIIDGGAGTDRVSLMTNRLNPSALPATGTWDMATGELTLTVDYPLTATVRRIEHADLSTYGTAWAITGSDKAETLRASGTAGTVFTALGGDDQFSGSAADDAFDGGAGNDRSLGMGDGDDTCTGVETFDYPDCENIS
jgi:Ca2+-binding RTX toxin-like protein